MRFRKSIKIMKSVRLNFSKSGVSLTAGVRGASVNFGSKGTYLNTGIPGTGLYDRTRIDEDINSSSIRASAGVSSHKYVELAITVGIEDNGSYFIKDQNGSLITDETILRKIKRSEAYKDKILELGEKFVNEKTDENQAFIDIHKLSPVLISESDVNHGLEHLQPLVYKRKSFEKSVPDQDAMRSDLEATATRDIWSLAFWTLKKRRSEFVASNLPIVFESAMKQYHSDNENFIASENQTEEKKNGEYLEAFNLQKSELHSFLSGKQDWVEEKIDLFLGDMTLPVDFSVSYEYNETTGELSVDLDLPEIEDLPTTKATSLSSGKVKAKEKTQKEIRQEYLRCISGLAFFFACSFFNISTHISSVLISGFTQRLNKKTGKVADDYVYSVVFDRVGVSAIEVSNIDPVVAFESFPHRRSVSKTYDVASIVPFTGFQDKN